MKKTILAAGLYLPFMTRRGKSPEEIDSRQRWFYIPATLQAEFAALLFSLYFYGDK